MWAVDRDVKIYHIQIEADDEWYVLNAVEDEAVFSQARTLDEAVLMMRKVLAKRRGDKDAELRLLVPADLPVNDPKKAGYVPHPHFPVTSRRKPVAKSRRNGRNRRRSSSVAGSR